MLTHKVGYPAKVGSVDCQDRESRENIRCWTIAGNL
ncbi:unnamed protein product [Brugia timori]|uniref:Uncharacterized protein n=1 Tax=Brugia timori TaxID=42155 RepID=A0A0R3Q609_9BILA|nr:unnamed protein product [Brugia timori]